MTDQAPDDDRTVVRPTTARPASTGFQATSLDMQPTLAVGGPPPRPAPGDDMGNGLPVGTRLGEFEITRLVGEGGFGIVYEAIDHSLGRRVALKEYMPSALAARNANSQVQVKSERHRETFEAGRKSFVNEARLLASFDHPALVKVYRFWEGNGTAYMVMQFLEGKTLREILREQRQAGLPPPDESWLRSVLGPLTEALLVIHGEQCYHRDIAPDNVMQLANGRWLLLDFGAARRVIGDMTQALTVILKPGYAPIEQYAEIPGMKQGAWTDVYALAAVVYFAIMGRTPPPSVSRMLNDTYQPLVQAAAGRYGEPFLRAIDRALAVRPEERTQTIGELRQQLGLGDAALDPLAALPPVPGGTLPAAAAAADAPITLSASAQTAAATAMPRAAPAAPPTPPPPAAPPAATAGKRHGAALGIGIGAVLLAALGLGVYSFVAPGGTTRPAEPPASAAAAAGPASAAPSVVVAAPAASTAPPAAEPAPALPAAATVPAAPAAFDPLRELERVVAGQTPGFVVRAETPKSVLRIGKDEFRFSVTSERDGYLTVLGLAPEGTLARLVPNQRSGVVRLKKGQAWRFPAGDGFALDTQDPPGPTQLLLIVSASPRSFDALKPETSGPVQVFPPRDVLATLAARQDAAAPPLAGRAWCSGAPACPDDYGAALLRFDTQH